MVIRARIALWGCQVPLQYGRQFNRSCRSLHTESGVVALPSFHFPNTAVSLNRNESFVFRIPKCIIFRNFATSAAGTRASGKSWNTMTLWQSGMNRPQPVQISMEERTIRGSAPVMKKIRLSIAGTDTTVQKYLDLHKGSAENVYLYEGAFATGVKRAKMFSLLALALSGTGGPFLMMSSSATLLQTFLGAAVVVGGVLASGVIHVITTPYVLSLRRLADGSFQAETALVTGAVKYTHFTRQEVMPSNKPFCTFSAKGHYFYVHKELFVGDDAQAAESMYEEQLKKNPGDLDALYNYGRFLWKVRGDLEAAEVAFTKILAEDPTDREALKVLKAVQVLRQPAPQADQAPEATPSPAQ